MKIFKYILLILFTVLLKNNFSQNLNLFVSQYDFRKVKITIKDWDNKKEKFIVIDKNVFLNDTGKSKNSIIPFKGVSNYNDTVITLQIVPHIKEESFYDTNGYFYKLIKSNNVMPGGWESDTFYYYYKAERLDSVYLIESNGDYTTYKYEYNEHGKMKKCNMKYSINKTSKVFVIKEVFEERNYRSARIKQYVFENDNWVLKRICSLAFK